MTLRLFLLLPFSCFLVVFFTSCDSSTIEEFVAAETVVISDFPADPFVGVDAVGRPIGTNKFSFLDLETGMAVLDSLDQSWDIGFRGTSIIVNGGSSGPGSVTAQIKEGTFQEFMTAPESGYLGDSSGALAIPEESDNSWYSYDPTIRLVSPLAGRVIFVKTTEQNYAKFRVISYYKGAPDSPNSNVDEGRYYTIELALQEDGSRRFE